MDQRERADDVQEGLRVAMDGLQARIWTMLPGIIDSYDPAKNTAQVQPAIMGIQRQSDGSLKPVTMPLLVDCPCVFPGGGGFVLTAPITKGDECVILLASRCIDAWWQSGGVQQQLEQRMHDLSDGFVFVGAFSLPNVPGGISTTTIQLRNKAGDTFVEIAGGQKVNVTAPGGINLNGFKIDSNGNAVTPGEVTAKNNHTVSAHTHTQPNDSHNDVEAPTNAPTG